jgi:hypothetical protein
MFRIARVLQVLFVFVLGFSATASAQVNTGSISGTVQDSSGAAVVGATVTAQSVATGEEHTTESGNIGQYTLQGLLPGTYRLRTARPGFKTFEATVVVTVGGNATVNASLEVGAASSVVEVTAAYGTEVNTQTQELSQLVDTTQLAQLPSLNRNAYDFVALSGNVSNGDNTTGSMSSSQNSVGRGVGYAINGQRSAGTEILLDGVENVEVFSVNPGQLVPADSIQEFSIITNNFGAEYGRASGGVVNVDTKSGTNEIHGSAFEYNRLSNYTANTFANDVGGTPKGTYVRNQFGYSIGGPILKQKLFAYFSEEFVRVRSAANETEDIFDPAFTSLLPANAASYFSKYATGAATAASQVTAGDLVSAGAFGSNCGASGTGNCPFPMIGGTTSIPSTTPVFDTIHFQAPFDAGGGVPENTYNLVGRLDYNLSNKTQIFFRYGRYRETDFSGANTYSPYPQYNTGDVADDDSALLSVTHSFTPSVLSNTKLSFTRFLSATSFDNSLVATPNLYLNPTTSQSTDPVTSNVIQLPGLQNTTSGSGGLPFGGPQNTLQVGEDLSWTKGRHSMRFGGEFTYIQLNVAYGAYTQAVEVLGGNLANSINSLVDAGGVTDSTGALATPVIQFTGRVAGGVLPCATDIYGNSIQTPSCTVTPPLAAASPARSYRYKDWAIYAQDSFKLTRRLTLNYGLRYEHYGVQHNDIQSLDSNFYPASGGFPQNIRNGAVQLTQQSSVGQFWAPRWGTPAPRVGFAYDVFGDGKTALRGGFGISYERNFGNVTYNASFNPPASAAFSAVCGANSSGIVTTCGNLLSSNSLGPLGLSTTPPSPLPPVELRDDDAHINVAQSQFWSMAVERQVMTNSVLSISYSGAHGVHLYDINNINLLGAGQAYAGDPLVTTPVNAAPPNSCGFSYSATLNACYTRLNSAYSNINDRGSNGVSTYNALNIKFQTQDLHHTGLTLIANYTWAHSLDDLSTTFSESYNAASLGYTNYLHPQLDYGNSDFDVRQRVVLSPIWQTPWFKSGRGFKAQVLGGWNFSGIYTARTGIPFSVYDLSNLLNFYVIPRLTPATPITQYHVGSPVQISPTSNAYTALTVPASANLGPLNPALGISDFGPFPANMSGRNAFRGPGAWNTDAAIQKNFKLTERFGLDFRMEAFDLFNHHNYYVFAGGNYAVENGQPTQVTEFKGGLGSLALGGNHDERRFGQFSLRLTF